MAVSIFNIVPIWVAGNTYKKYDRVKYIGRVYYALKDHSGSSTIPSTDFNNWGGVMIDPFGTALTEIEGELRRPHFFFSPSYGSTIVVEPKVLSTKFGDGYEQRTPDGINNALIKIDLTFELRSNAECAAIIHFLTARAGAESFLFTPQEPYATLRNFVCRSWNHTAVFFENNMVKTAFEQVPY